MATRTKNATLGQQDHRTPATCLGQPLGAVLVGVLVLPVLMAGPVLLTPGSALAGEAARLEEGGDAPDTMLALEESPAVSRGLTLITPLTDDGTTSGGFGFTLPCLGLGAGEQPVGACLTAGSGSNQLSAPVGFGIHYGYDNWLNLGAGIGVETFGEPQAAAGGLTWSQSGGSRHDWSLIGQQGQQVSGTVSALVDVNALTGLELGGIRPFFGAGLSVGQVQADGMAPGGLAVTETTAHGMTWGATLGSNYSVADGISLDFAYRYAGQDATGSLDPGAGLGVTGRGGASHDDGDMANHGMSIGLRLTF